eukprot:2963267-Rhodomonas_salina.2
MQRNFRSSKITSSGNRSKSDREFEKSNQQPVGPVKRSRREPGCIAAGAPHAPCQHRATPRRCVIK